jgi:hypothetical protein
VVGTGERIWYGTLRARPGEARSARRLAVLLALGAVAVVLRLALPFTEHEAMLVHEQIVWALRNQENWGRQALVAMIHYPPMPTVALMVLEALLEVARRWLPAGWTLPPAAHWLVAICQVWTLAYLVRLAGLYRLRRLRYGVGLVLLAVLAGGANLADLDPYWVHLVLLASAWFHLCRWEQEPSLRDLAVVALLAGGLVFAGVPGMVCCAALLATVWAFGRREQVRASGGTALLLLPTLYALLLLPLFNLVVMGEPWFWLRHFWGLVNWPRLAASLGTTSLPVALTTLGVAGLAVALAAMRDVPLYSRTACHLTLGLGVVALLRAGGEVFVGGEALLVGGAQVGLLLVFLAHQEGRPRGVAWTLAVLGICGACLGAGTLYRVSAAGAENFRAASNPPPIAEIVELVDRYWERSRIKVYDLRTAALYAQAAPTRLVVRLDYRAEELDRERREEQLHLLLPPNNGRFYSRYRGALLDMHEQGRRWLLLEREWPSGWQLLRCIRVPPADAAPIAAPPANGTP